MITLLVNVSGVLLMAAIVWWFWLYRPGLAAQPDAVGIVQITVANGIYSPDHISVPVNHPTTLRFLRKDSSACASTVIFEELGISAELPLGEAKEVVITPVAPGHYSFSCPMKMYRGSLEVKDE